jgi:ASC-1-like (ASCH) protein
MAHHVAIMRPSWRLIPKILSGEKTIESRWYQTRRAPWDGIEKGDTVFFKDSGRPVTARAEVAKVLQFEIKNLADARRVVRGHGRAIQIVNPDPKKWGRLPRYCVLIFLARPRAVSPFRIDKRGFGSAAAWLTVKNVSSVRTR